MSLLSKARITQRAPINLFLNLTARCNLSCTYCSSDGLYEDGNIEELTTEDYQRLADRFDDLGVFRLILTGGEPFVRSDIMDLIKMLRPDRRRFTINTNGTLIDDALAKSLSELGVKTCCVSIDSADESGNARTRGPGSLARALAGVTALKKVNLQVSILTVITRDNLSLDNVRELAKMGEEYRASVSVSPVSAYGRAEDNYDELGLDYEQLIQLDEYVQEVRQDYPMVSVEIQRRVYEYGPQDPEESKATLLSCDAAKKTCAITADGWVLPCNKMPNHRCGNVKTEDIAAIWNSEKMLQVRRLDSMPTRSVSGCADCRHVNYCSGGCRADAYYESGDLLGDNPICRMFLEKGESR